MFYKCIKIILAILLFNISINSIGMGKNFKNQEYKKTIAIDLDGVLNTYNGKYDKSNIPDIKEGAKEFIKNLSEYYELVLFTNRNPMLATKWLIKNNLDVYFKEVTNIKPIAVIYIDDRAINFNGDYNKVLYDIKNFKTYYE